MTAEANTRRVVDALYAAFLGDDPDGMLALMSDDVEVRFLGQGTFCGLPAARRFLGFAGGLLSDLDFTIEDVIIDGEIGCTLWHERATTAAGEPWTTHGVDVIRVRDGRIVLLHVNNDASLVHRHFPPYHDVPERT